MARKPGPLQLDRTDACTLVKELLERAGDVGITKQEILAAIGPDRTSLSTIQRVLDDLRKIYDAQLTCSGADRRWRLHGTLAMPLDAPTPEHVITVHMAKVRVDELGDPSLSEHMMKIVEAVDDRFRERGVASSLPARKTMTSSLRFSTIIDHEIFREVLLACRRIPLRIKHVSPWKPPTDAAPWQTIEPWALHMFDGTAYVAAWSRSRDAPRKYRLVDVTAVEHVDEGERQSPRQPIPSDIWGDENPAYGIDHDRPEVAVIRLQGDVARWVARVRWHEVQRDNWIVPGELLERRFAYRSCRELARHLSFVIDAIVSIEPRELHDEVFGMWRRSPAAAGEQMINS